MAIDAEHVIVEITTSTAAEAERIARALVEGRLAGSAQVSPTRTWYRWKGAVHETEEHVVRSFTRRDRFDAVAAKVRELHSYEVPQVVAVPLVAVTSTFARWLDETSQEATHRDDGGSETDQGLRD